LGIDREIKTPANCIVAGWGNTERQLFRGGLRKGKNSPILKQVNITVMSNEYCNTNTAYKNRGLVIDNDNEFCAGEPGRRLRPDSCNGDSGGPLYCCENGNLVQVFHQSYK